MDARDLAANQLQFVHRRMTFIEDMPARVWLSRPAEGDNRVGFTAWHVVATRDWTIRSVLQAKRPLGWDAPFAGTGIAKCELPFGMPLDEADAIAEAVSPAEVVAYSAAVTEEFVSWLKSVDSDVLAAPPANGRDHLALSPRYDEAGYRHEFEGNPADMSQWPVWMLLSRPSMLHCFGHFGEIDVAQKLV